VLRPAPRAPAAVTAVVLRRVAQLVLVVWGSITILFVLFFLLPEDPATLIAGGGGRNPDPRVVENINERYGFDQPVVVQYGRYLQGVATLDFGQSYSDGRPVSDIIRERAPASLRLAFWAIAIESVVGIGLGVLSATRRYSFADTSTTLLAAAFSAIPVFVLAFILQQITGVWAYQHGWPIQLPVQGIGPNEWVLGLVPSGGQLSYLVQPAFVLATVSTVIVARLARTTMLEVRSADYVRTARAKGLTEGQVTRRHAVPNAMIPVVTFIGIDFGTLVGAAILTEAVFNWPGLGSRIASAAGARDLPVVLGLSVVVILVYAVVNLLVDLSYAWLDPRVRPGERPS
jgi:oligopeptide transport system permease protein